MSPTRLVLPASSAADSALARVRSDFGRLIRDARQGRRWTTTDLAHRAGVSRWAVYLAERGEAVSLEVMARLATALGLRLEIELIDPRKRQPSGTRLADPVHSAMGEFEIGHLRPFGYGIAVDEPYQHYQFAGRADVVAWDLAKSALLHIENRTRFPDLQEMAGVFSAKRAYLGSVMAQRLGVGRWRSETHVIAALWSSEVLHALRIRSETFRALCPGDAVSFESWWAGTPPASGLSACVVVIDPLASARQRTHVGLDEAMAARPRYRGYSDAASAMMGGGEQRRSDR